uniref:RIN4 pathogenic type III effector avirulence factor Avr cleavage site domain-containing protein n=1 Tax=Kalanchoe fedtschenkoi TaxID=63787 RepID=A0A7N0VJH7_KALFE
MQVPKFGEWDVNDPRTAEGFTMIFNRARDEKKSNGSESRNSASHRDSGKNGKQSDKGSLKKKWFCCG